MKNILVLFGLFICVSTFGANNDLIIEQKIQFENSSKDFTIYYVKENNVYKVYSETNLTKQNINDVNLITSTSFRKTSSYKGKCYVTCNSLDEVIDLGTKLYKKYKKYILKIIS